MLVLRATSHGCVPLLQFRIQASKPKPYGYPQEIKTIGEHIRARRMNLGLLQKEVAIIINVSTSCIENWEKNRGFPNKMHIPKIKKFLGKDVGFTMPEMQLEERLKEYRKKHNLTQKMLAKSIGVGINTLIKIENKGGHILNSTYKKIEMFLN